MKPFPKWGMMLITTASLAFYIGLAVWGWGSWSAFMAHPAGRRPRRDGGHLGRGDVHERQHFERPPRGYQESLDPPALPGHRLRLGVAHADRRDIRTIDGDVVRYL